MNFRTRKTVRVSWLVPTLRCAPSTSSVLSVGNLSVDQITELTAPGRPDIPFLTGSSIFTRALPFLSRPPPTPPTLHPTPLPPHALPLGRAIAKFPPPPP